jgi:hypothetical protein
LPALAEDDCASVVFGAEVEDRTPDVPIGVRDERAGVEAHLARESDTLSADARALVRSSSSISPKIAA